MSDGKKIGEENESGEKKAVDGISGGAPQRPSDPIEDVREGLGLLFRAAKGAVEKIPTKDLEKSVVQGVSEFGKMMGRFAETVGSEIGKKATEIVTPKTRESGGSSGGIGVDPVDPSAGTGTSKADGEASAKSDSSDLPS